MSVIPEVKCRRCGESFSALRSRCPNCGTRRVTQSARTPSPTPSTVRGTASYERAETNTKWQMIFGLILVVAVILAVIVMVSTSLNGLDSGTVNVKVTTPPVTVAPPTIDTPPTPSPTPTPTVESIKVFNFNNEIKTDFTMHLSQNEKVALTATAYPVEQFTDARFTWKSGDETLMKVTPTDDTKGCTCEILGTKAGGVTLTVSCNGTDLVLTVYLVN